MTIDEAIILEKQKSEIYKKDFDYSSKYHKQIAEFLEELKEIKKWKSEIISDFAKYDATCADEIYQKGKNDAIDELKGKKDEIIRWLIKRDKEGYGTTNGELLDNILGIAEEMKEGAGNDNRSDEQHDREDA